MSRERDDRTPPTALERLISASHRIRVLGRPIHPYLALCDLALCSALALGAGYSRLVDGRWSWRYPAIFVAVHFAYHGAYAALKARVFGVRSRSFLQDTVLFILPLYLGLAWCWGHPPAVALDLLGLVLPLSLGLVRLGCFLGGCCYGAPSPWGVVYPPSVFVTCETRWRRFTPGSPTYRRVFPIQLVESALNLALFVALLARAWFARPAPGATILLYFLVYCPFRFLAEPHRGHRHRPRYGRLSEAQWAALALTFACGLIASLRR